MIGLKSPGVPQGEGAGAAGAGPPASTAMALPAKAALIRPRNIVWRSGAVIAFTFSRNPYEKTIQPNFGGGKLAHSCAGVGTSRVFRAALRLGSKAASSPSAGR